jgi:hypothetical protein
MERAWEVWKTTGGVVLLVLAFVWLAGSAHQQRPVETGAEFLAAVEYVKVQSVHEVRRGLHWLSAEGR